jgi:hypothetical protein
MKPAAGQLPKVLVLLLALLLSACEPGRPSVPRFPSQGSAPTKGRPTKDLLDQAQQALELQEALVDLETIWLMYVTYQEATGKPPTKAEDLEGHQQKYSSSYQKLLKGNYVFVWNVSLRNKEERKPLEKVILGHEAKVHANGKRAVVLCGGSAKSMTEKEFQAAPRAEGK